MSRKKVPAILKGKDEKYQSIEPNCLQHNPRPEGGKKDWKNPLKVGFCCPTVYSPLLLLTLLTLLVQCSGSAFIKKFLIQILSSDTGGDGGDVRLNYFLPILILSVKLVVTLLMSFLVHKFRVRLLYYLSLFTTLIMLVCLALASDPALIGPSLSNTTLKWIKTVIICLHIFSTQLGLNTLPQMLEITIFPTSCKAVMKGIMRAISSTILVVFVFVFKALEYSHTFYLMATILLLASPLLYLYVPEIRKLGSEMSAEFFLPSRTVFYFSLPKSRNFEHITSVTVEDNVKSLTSLTEVYEDENLTKKNKERVNYVYNILMSMGNQLSSNKSYKRILIGKGPVEYRNTGRDSKRMKKGSIFLFDDCLIVAKCIVSSRHYNNEIYFNRQELSIEMDKEDNLLRTLTVSDQDKSLEMRFEDRNQATVWFEYISFSESLNV